MPYMSHLHNFLWQLVSYMLPLHLNQPISALLPSGLCTHTNTLAHIPLNDLAVMLVVYLTAAALVGVGKCVPAAPTGAIVIVVD